MRQHWLVRPATIGLLWGIFAAVLVASVLIQLVYPVEGHFGIDGGFAFNAWYGLAVCAAMILFAKLIGMLLKRDDAYYDR
ncbi:MAG: hypothetical protein ACREUQ_04630 [Burkholderiales bacterium]